jgi:hydrogenase nickel incorporation protein HypA/HybF
MHEISIIESILEVAEEKAREFNSSSIKVIKLRLGQFTDIARASLEFAFEVARLGTLAENARLDIEVVPMILHCVVCDVNPHPTGAMSLICSFCGFPLKIISGKELQIDFIEIDEYLPARNALANFPQRPEPDGCPGPSSVP